MADGPCGKIIYYFLIDFFYNNCIIVYRISNFCYGDVYMKNLAKRVSSHPIYTCIFTAIFINLIIEILGRKTFSDFFNYIFKSPIVFFYNALIILFTLS